MQPVGRKVSVKPKKTLRNQMVNVVEKVNVIRGELERLHRHLERKDREIRMLKQVIMEMKRNNPHVMGDAMILKKS